MSLPALVQPHRSTSGRGITRAARLMKMLGPAASGVWAELSPAEADQLSVAMNATAAPHPDEPDADAFLAAFDRHDAPAEIDASGSIWTRLGKLDPAVIARHFAGENPQIIAVVLARLDPDTAARTVRAFSRDTAIDALRRMLHLGRIHKDAMAIIEQAATELVSANPGASASDGHETVARIFDQLGSREEQSLLADLDAREPGAGGRVRALMFTFDDLAALDPGAIQTLLSSVDRSDLAVALKGSAKSVRDTFLKNMTKRAGDVLVSEIETMGPVRRSDIDTARQDIIRIARTLTRRGDILSPAADDELVE
ncbi:MAG: FliG C-terminal domain-containing protein [Henriciella sp.]|uniref:flagellar motor switch protein FliG n=1 Tax=Henriciella sp. TaxID=1968823 RepID=UPI003C727500